MLDSISSASSAGAPRAVIRTTTRWVGILACFCFGCPGVEPSASGSGGGSGAGGRDGVGGRDTSTGQSTTGPGGCDADLNTDVKNCGKCGRVCVDDDRVKVPRCIEGVCQSFCESGFVNIEAPATGADDGCEASGRRVFVTEATMTGIEVGSVSAADDRCQARADALELGGQWRAWLSDQENGISAEMRFTREPDAPYMLLDFAVVAGSWALLVGPNGTNGVVLDHAINLTESKTVVSTVHNVWTGTTALGLAAAPHCTSWTGAGTSPKGVVGDATQVTANWTQQEAASPCGEMARLYCFEQ